MSEFWCDYEARTNWLQMYSIPNISSPEDESEEKESEEDLHEEIEEIETPRQTRSSVKRRKNGDNPLSPRNKRIAKSPKLRPASCDQVWVTSGSLIIISGLSLEMRR